MKTYHFKVKLCGIGLNADDAWLDAVEGLNMEPGPTPDDADIEIVDEEDEDEEADQ